MNFLDIYDVSGPGTPREGPTLTLNEEVNQVVGHLSRFWGGFRKQSQTALESARKDLSQVVSQAQQELTKLASESSAEASSPTNNAASEAEAERTPVAETAEQSATPGTSMEGSSETNGEPSASPTGSQRPRHGRSVSVSAAAQNLFSRLQSSLPSNLASTVQAQIPESLKQGAGSVDFTQLRTTLATEFQRVQGITRAQAEGYVHKSEELLREAGEFLKDAVKVVPPEEGQAPVGMLWDGTDVWMLPDMATDDDSKGKGKERQSSDGRASIEAHLAGATRAKALLKQLRHDPEVIRADPQVDARARELWAKWLQDLEADEHGILNEKWTAAIQAALSDPEDGDALQVTMDGLVPSAMPNETFWTRYFFREHQVEVEEERRKALIEGTVESEEDINWESDDEEDITDSKASALSTESHKAQADPTPRLAGSRETLTAKKGSVVSTPATGSPRASSEGSSYDVVSSQVSNAGDSKAGEGDERKRENAGDDESDWE